MTDWTFEHGWIALDGRLRVGIQQTLRVPEQGGPYPLPPALGRLPVLRPQNLPDRSGDEPPLDCDFVVGLHPQEALWLQFSGPAEEPRAVKIAVGAIDALTGRDWKPGLHTDPQDYLVCPYQPWLDGFHTAGGVVRQFVAVTPGAGVSVEHQLSGQDTGLITMACYRPAARLPDLVPRAKQPRGNRHLSLGAGGEIRQRIYPDPYGVSAWAPSPAAVIRLRLLDARELARLTDQPLRPSSIDAGTYSRFGLPWFEVHDAARGDVPPTREMSSVQSVEGLSDAGQKQPGFTPENVRPIPPRSKREN